MLELCLDFFDIKWIGEDVTYSFCLQLKEISYYGMSFTFVRLRGSEQSMELFILVAMRVGSSFLGGGGLPFLHSFFLKLVLSFTVVTKTFNKMIIFKKPRCHVIPNLDLHKK